MPSEDYFKSLEDKILAKTSGNVFHLPLGLAHPFVAPKGYFEALDDIMLAKINANSFELKEGITHPFEAPQGYFEGLEIAVLSKKNSSDFDLKENILHPFKAPKGYFNNLDKAVYSKTINQKPQSGLKIVWRNYGQFIRIAASLLIVGIFGLGIYSNFNTNATEELTLSELRTEAIYTYLEEQNLKLDDFEAVSEEFAVDSFSEINDTEMDVYSEEELLELINFQYSNDI